jgi:hypothetical protein
MVIHRTGHRQNHTQIPSPYSLPFDTGVRSRKWGKRRKIEAGDVGIGSANVGKDTPFDLPKHVEVMDGVIFSGNPRSVRLMPD